MMQYENVLFETDTAGIALVTINRPDKLNALSAAVIAELRDAFERIAETRQSAPPSSPERARRPSWRARISTNWRRCRRWNARSRRGAGSRLSPLETRASHRGGRERVRAGRRTGAGHGLHGAVRLGKRAPGAAGSEARDLPGYGGTQRLPRLVGRGRALEMLLSGEPITPPKRIASGW